MDTRTLIRWQDLTTEAIADHARRDAVVVLPMAAIEQHGPHLPLETDLRIGLGLLDAAATILPSDLEPLVLPPLAIATSAEHTHFAGTLSLTPETALAVLREIGAGVAHAGFRRLVLANSHGGNTAIMELAALDLRRDHGLLVTKHHYFLQPLPDTIDIPERECRHGLHGGLSETAMMRVLAPTLVQMDRAPDARSLGEDLEGTTGRLGPTGETAFAWMADDLNPEGVVGAADRATPELGQALIDHYAEGLAQAITDTAAFPIERLAR
ncbi:MULTISPECIES: creatininase family protein [unclassified Thioalkalivibrio]|uniref:creatininase family protein n=1 Tax=unclassified Thioalkalivibrio TaxID=2621013 RepID=UPI00035F9F1F|nr:MULTISPECIES: creatininase family protein [unclassified Thioalkalivibrio]